MVCGVTFIMLMLMVGALRNPRTAGRTRNGIKTEHVVNARRRAVFEKGRGLRGLACCMATASTGTAAVAVRQLAKLPYETGLALQLSLARKYKEARLDEVRTNLKNYQNT